MLRDLFSVLILSVFITAASDIGAAPLQGATTPLVQTKEAQETDLARRQFEFQKELEGKKLDLEKQRLDFEKQKNDQAQGREWLNVVSIWLPVSAGLITVGLQLNSARKLREAEAKSSFELKAAEIVMNAETPSAAHHKALALKDLFPNKLPESFATSFEPKDFSGPVYKSKAELFRAAAAKASTPQEITKLWQDLFPDDEWAKKLISNPDTTGIKKNGQTESQKPVSQGG